MHLRFRSTVLGAACAFLTLTAARQDARACGGGAFFYTYTDPADMNAASVDGHRVVISLAPTQTVIWDQIAYRGAPQDFAWVMPVQEGAHVEVASDAWLETLDATTATRVSSPTVFCQPESPSESHGGCLCSPPYAGGKGSDGSGSFDDNPSPPVVTIVHEGSIGPYETVTIKSDTPSAIGEWLTMSGYKIPADVQPILDDYAAQGMSFIALRLKPDQGVNQMKPVRVITPGAVTTFPMRMLSAGTQQSVAIKLFVITEGRVQVDAFANAEVDPKSLIWDLETHQSNYDDVRRKLLAGEGGKTWLTTYAKPQTLLGSDGNEYYPVDHWVPDTIAGAYMTEGFANEEVGMLCSPPRGLAQSAARVVNLCPPDGGACAAPGPDEIDARDLDCGELKDLSMALTGLHPKDVWLTRLEAELPREALTTDLTLSPRQGTMVVNHHLVADDIKDRPSDCSIVSGKPPAGMGLANPPSRHGEAMVTLALAALGGALARRVRRPRAAIDLTRAI